VPGGDQQIISAMLPDQLCAVITAAPGGEGSMAEWAFVTSASPFLFLITMKRCCFSTLRTLQHENPLVCLLGPSTPASR
jgi:hypothetical protein